MRAPAPRSVFVQVGGATVSVHCSGPGTAPLSWARSTSFHVHLGAPATVEGVLDDRRFAHVARRGDFSVVPVGCPSGEEWGRPVHYLTVELGADDTIADPAAFVPVARRNDARLAREAERVSAELLRGPLCDQWQLEELVVALGERVRSVVCGADGPTDRTSTRGSGLPMCLDSAVLREIVDRIHDEYATGVSVPDLARTAGLSVAHFARSFRASVGCTPHQYLIRVRVRRAERLLALTDLPISDVAVRVGFAHQSHLHRHFSRWTGTTPGRFVRYHRDRAPGGEHGRFPSRPQDRARRPHWHGPNV